MYRGSQDQFQVAPCVNVSQRNAIAGGVLTDLLIRDNRFRAEGGCVCVCVFSSFSLFFVGVLRMVFVLLFAHFPLYCVAIVALVYRILLYRYMFDIVVCLCYF